MGSDAVEDYLKAIYELQEAEGRAKTSRLAERLGLTAGSVTDMVKRLGSARPQLVSYRHHQGVRLTSRGKKEALSVIRRHRLVESFLFTVLGLSWDEVHREAEVLEHHVSPRVLAAMDALLGHPAFDPHGEPIPDPDGRLPAVSQRRLSEAEVGSTVRILRVFPVSGALLRHLDGIGLGLGTIGTVVEKAAFDGAMVLRRAVGGIDAADVAVSRSVAESLFVAEQETP